MANYGTLYCTIYDQALTNLSPSSQVFTPVSARGSYFLNRVGNGQVTLKLPENPTESDGYPTIYPGRIAAVYVNDAIASANVTLACFTIKNVMIETDDTGMTELQISGPSLEGELAGYKHFVDIGSVWTTTQIGAESSGAETLTLNSIATTSTTLVQQAHQGETDIRVTDNSGFSIGDDVVIQMGTGTPLTQNDYDHTTIVTNVYVDVDSGYDSLTIQDPMPDDAKSTNKVGIPEIFTGNSILITNDAGNAIHYTRISDNPYPPGFNTVTLVEPLPWSIASGGNAVSVRRGQEVTSSAASEYDIALIMDPATDNNWTLTPTNAATANGTAHEVDGASIIDLLMAASDATGEYWRFNGTVADPAVPTRTLKWFSTPDASGITLVMPSAANISARYTSTSYGVILSMTRETKWEIVTEVAAIGGDDTFDLNDATDALPAGFALYHTRGVWVLVNENLSGPAGEITYRDYVKFDGITPVTESTASKVEAANRLQDAAVTYLQDHDDKVRFFKIRAVIHGDVWPGQSITLDYTETNWTESSTTLYVSEVQHEMGDDGVRYTDLLCSEDSPLTRETGATKVARALLSGVTAGRTSTIAGGGAGGGGGSGTTYTAGANISISGNTIALKNDVVIGNSLAIGNGKILALWDTGASKYRKLILEDGYLRWEDV